MSNAVLKRIHQVIGNLVRDFNISQTYVDKNYLCTGVSAAAAFAILSTTNMLKVFSLGQLVFFCDMILPIKHEVDLELIHKRKCLNIQRPR